MVIIAIGEASNAYTVVLGDHTAIQHPRKLVVSPRDASGGSSHNLAHVQCLMYGNGPPVHRLASILSGLLAPEISPIQEQRIIQYNDRYRLAFTLLNENATSDHLVNSWDIQPAIVGKLFYFISSGFRRLIAQPTDHLFPILSQLNVLHNTTVESQVQYHAPLAFEPVQLANDNTSFHGVTPEDLTVFINSAEWSLCNYPAGLTFGMRVLTYDSASSVSSDPVLHFVLFVPSSSRRQLCILDAHGKHY